jgi:hypothetical protein
MYVMKGRDCEHVETWGMGLDEEKMRAAYAKYVNGTLRTDYVESGYYTITLTKVETDDDGIVVSETVLERTKLYEQGWWIELEKARNKRYEEEDQ